MEQRLKLRYQGPAVDAGLMDVYEASANMIAFSDFVLTAAKAAFGEKVDARAQVAGFGHGSFVTDLVFNVAGPTLTVLSSTPPEMLLKIVSEAIAIWKHLKGAQPTRVEHQTNQQTVQVTNNQGQVIQVQIQSLNVVFNDKAVEATQRFIREPLSGDGIEEVEIGDEKGNSLAVVKPSEAAYFGPVAPSETVTDVVVRMALVIEAPVFKDDNKWRFYDGTNTIYAAIEDKEFQARVDGGEKFGKGDILLVDMRILQERAVNKITAERSIVKVLEHRSGPDQGKLFASQ